MATTQDLGDERVVRVFISSTFRDMVPERDVLVRSVFPQIRQHCAERAVAFTEIDLRWGLTDEEAAEGKVLGICLAEIDRCKPFFIGLLGERYGWVPSDQPTELLDEHPWLRRHVGTTSVTELEILHAVLDDAETDHRAFFYLRDPAYPSSERFRADAARYDLDPDDYREDPADDGSAERSGRLDALKRRLRASGLPVREPIADPDELAAAVLADLTAAIDEAFPEATSPGVWELQRRTHEFFAAARTHPFVGRNAELHALDDLVTGSDGGDVHTVVGDPGSGKSALVASWAAAYRSRHPGVLVFTHHAAASAEASRLSSLVGRLGHALADHLGIDADDDPGGSSPDAVQACVQLLAKAGRRGRVVVVVDGLDQLAADARPSAWLATDPPAGVTLVAATAPGDALRHHQGRGWSAEPLVLRPLDVPQRRDLVHECLRSSAKQLTEGQVDAITSPPQADSPRYLRILLDELRTWGRHETLDSRIRRLTRAKTTAELVEVVLEGFERDFDAARPGLVRDVFSLLWASNRGLTESELADLLGTDDGKLPAARWAPLRAAAAALLADHDGLLDTADAHVDAAVVGRYLPTVDARRAVHERLADHFGSDGWTLRGQQEVPHQLMAMHSWDRLAACLADPAWFVPLWRDEAHVLLQGWLAIGEEDPDRVARAYTDPGPAEPERLRYLNNASLMLRRLGAHDAALGLLEAQEAIARGEGERFALQASLHNQALIHAGRHDDHRALELLAEQEQVARGLDDVAALASCLDSQAVIHASDAPARALELFEEEEEICRRHGHLRGLACALGGQGRIWYRRGDYDRALSLHRQEEAIYRDTDDPEGLGDALTCQAAIHHVRGDLDEAMRLYREDERLGRAVHRLAKVASALGNQAQIHETRGELDRAAELLREQEELYRRADMAGGVASSYGLQASLCWLRGDFDEAMRLFREQEAMATQFGDRSMRQAALGGLAMVHHRLGDTDRALELVGQRRAICEDLGLAYELQDCLGTEGVMRHSRNELDVALECMREQERLCRESGNVEGEATALGNQALVHFDLGELDRATELHRRSATLGRRIASPSLVARSRVSEARILLARTGGARRTRRIRRQIEALFDEALALANESGDAHLVETINDMANAASATRWKR